MTTQELISARSNEANLGQEEFAWLLFGIHDKTHAVLGSSYKPTRPSLDALKREIAEGTNCALLLRKYMKSCIKGKELSCFKFRQFLKESRLLIMDTIMGAMANHYQ